MKPHEKLRHGRPLRGPALCIAAGIAANENGASPLAEAVDHQTVMREEHFPLLA